MLDDLRVSLFLAVRATKRGGTGRLFMNIFIIALVLTNMIFLPSIIVGSIEIFNQQNIDYLTSDIVIEPREDDMYIENLDELMPGLNRIPGVVRASAWYESPASIQLEEESVTIKKAITLEAGIWTR